MAAAAAAAAATATGGGGGREREKRNVSENEDSLPSLLLLTDVERGGGREPSLHVQQYTHTPLSFVRMLYVVLYPTASWRQRTKAEVWQDGIQPPSNFWFIFRLLLIPSMAKTSRAKHLCKHGQMLPIFFLFMGRAEKERERWREQSAIVRQEERKNSGPSSSSPSLTFLSRSLPYFSLLSFRAHICGAAEENTTFVVSAHATTATVQHIVVLCIHYGGGSHSRLPNFHGSHIRAVCPPPQTHLERRGLLVYPKKVSVLFLTK